MKKNHKYGARYYPALKKSILIMRLVIVISLISIMQTFASNAYTQNTKISLSVTEMKLEEIFMRIESDTYYRFAYDKNDINVDQTYSVNVKNAEIKELLSQLFSKGKIEYALIGRQIVLSDPNKPIITQQLQSISGRVTDSSGSPLPGVTVVLKGSTQGTVTDSDGSYALTNVPGNATLVFSFVGMKTQETKVEGKTIVNIVLEEDVVGIEEVIAIGYGTAKRQDYTGSVSSLKLENSSISFLPNMNALESLKGTISGLNIGATNTSGGEPSMLIRGQNSINGSNNPLIVLDGVIYMGSLSDINPNDIAKYDILKDAVSSAAYGSRSANGIIVITTKKGSSEKPLITFNSSFGIQTWQKPPVLMKGKDWINVVNARNKYPEGSTDWLMTGELANLAAGKETYWLDEVTQMGLIQDYQLSVSGNANGVNYYLSTSYSENKGVVVGDDFNRISILGKINTDVTNWLKVGVDASYSRRDYSGFAANISSAQAMSPYGVMYRDDDGHLEKYPYTQSATNPLWGVDDETSDNLDIRQNFRLNSYAVVNVPWIKGLSYRINFLTNLDKNHSGNFYHENFYIAEGEGLTRYEPATVQGFLTKANGNLDNNSMYSYVFDNIINYKNKFNKHNIEGTFVATRDYSKYEDENVSSNNFSANGNTTLGMWGLHKATVQKIDLDGEKRTNIGYLGRISYSFNDRYYFTTSYRRDGTSVFGSKNKWADFAALGIAWKISSEDFMENFNPLDILKLKLSWGQNGNQGVEPYTTLSQVSNGSSGGIRYEFSNTPGTIYYGLVQSTLGNHELGWESTESWNMGFESSWLKERLSIDMDVYFSKTTDQIFNRNIPVMTGFRTITTSLGQVNNTGVELTFKTVNIQRKDLNWSSSVTFWKNNNKLVKLYGEDNDGDGKEDDDIANGLFIGESLGTIYGYEQDGIVQEDDTEYMALTGASPGYPKYKDTDGVPGITAADRNILGGSKENFNLNMSNSLKFRNFEFYAMVIGNFGGNNHYLLSNALAFQTARPGLFKDNMPYKPYWTPENKSNVYPSATFSGDGRFLGLQSRGFVRVQDISLSYTFKQHWVRSSNINSLKVFLAAKNVITFTNWDGGDPETGATYLSNTFPVVSTYSIGAKISF